VVFRPPFALAPPIASAPFLKMWMAASSPFDPTRQLMCARPVLGQVTEARSPEYEPLSPPVPAVVALTALVVLDAAPAA
jgi:hypothetical protein